jgi:hypothetical protein
MVAGAFPNLFVVGAMKAGSSAVHDVLSRHPQIFMSIVKEPKYFAFLDETRRFAGPRDPDNHRYWTDPTRYRTLFPDDAASRTYVGESSTIYLYSPSAARRIAEAVPGARIIAVLRNPVDRAYSHFNFVRQRGLEPESAFRRGWDLEEERTARGWGSMWHYKKIGFYADQIERYFQVFPRQQTFIALYDDLRADPVRFYREILEFLELPFPSDLDTTRVVNPTSRPRVVAVEKVVNRARRILPDPIRARFLNSHAGQLLVKTTIRPLRKLNFRPVLPLAPEDRQCAAEYYRPSIRRLEVLLGKSLERWLAREHTR